jgi:hypothetical protein
VRLVGLPLAGVASVCDECGGKRFQASVLGYLLAGKNIADVLDMPVDEAAQFFGPANKQASTPAAHAVLERMRDAPDDLLVQRISARTNTDWSYDPESRPDFEDLLNRLIAALRAKAPEGGSSVVPDK